jgi:hypothetical protein
MMALPLHDGLSCCVADPVTGCESCTYAVPQAVHNRVQHLPCIHTFNTLVSAVAAAVSGVYRKPVPQVHGAIGASSVGLSPDEEQAAAEQEKVQLVSGMQLPAL